MMFGEAWRADIDRTYNHRTGSKLKRIINTIRSPGVQVMTLFRFGGWSMSQPKLIRIVTDPIYFITNGILKIMWGIELPRNTIVGPGCSIGHFSGIIISDRAELGSNCTISHGVTIGTSGKGEKCGAPTIGDNVYFAAGCKVFGKISIPQSGRYANGNNVKIGANAVVHKSIPDNAIVVCYPGFKILSYQDAQITTEDIPDLDEQE
jgi:serine O-acetyltransferase